MYEKQKKKKNEKSILFELNELQLNFASHRLVVLSHQDKYLKIVRRTIYSR